MKLSDRYDGSRAPFEGDRTLLLKALPVGARVVRATATLTPFDASGGANPFTEIINFDGTTGEWGATKTVVPGRWVEVDFHGRRTLAAVSGSNLPRTTLQADLGGAYVEISLAGGIRAPNDQLFALLNNDDPLPSLTVTKFKLTNPAGAAATPDVSRVTIRSTPTNVSLRLGELPTFWTYPGELTRPAAVPDFAPVLQAVLAGADIEHGYFSIPLFLHSDSIARLVVELEVEYLLERSLLPAGLGEVVLPFDLSGLPQAPGEVLRINVPPDSRVASSGTAARVSGAFGDTRLVRETVSAAAHEGFAEVSPALSQAQPVELSSAEVVSDIDLLVNVTGTARLQLDLRDDSDGKPAPDSLLPAPIKFELPGPSGHEERPGAGRAPKWVSVHLPTPFKFKQAVRYWLVLQSVEGNVAWAVAASATTPGAQRTDDDGLSWRDASADGVAPPLRAFFRLRRRPSGFKMPIELAVGVGKDAVPLNLERFESLGRVEFALDADLVGALNAHLDKKATPSCPTGEHLHNGDFEQWLRVGESLTLSEPVRPQSSPLSVAVAPDGTWAYVGSQRSSAQGVLQVLDVACDVLLDAEVQLLLVPHRILFGADGQRAYATDDRRIQVVDAGTHRTLGGLFDPAAATGATSPSTIEAIALSPDGARLYAVVNIGSPPGSTAPLPPGRRILVIDTARLEQAVAGRLPHAEAVTLPATPFGQTATAAAVSPDGSLLYVTAVSDGEDRRGELFVFDAASLQPHGAPVRVGRIPLAVALAPDGRHGLVVNAFDDNVSFIETDVTNRVVTTRVTQTLDLNTQARGVPTSAAIAPDGVRAYVISQETNRLTFIDVQRRASAQELSLPFTPRAMSLTPQADRIYVSTGEVFGESPFGDVTPLLSIQVGTRQPVAWELTGGRVSPDCLPEPFRQRAVLEQPRQSAPPPFTRAAASSQSPAAISQVVAVSGGCAYEFSFLGLATEPDALAEVFWLGGDCGPAKAEPDRIQIQALPSPPGERSEFLSAPMALHHQRLVAPATAEQAEVRFSVLPDVLAVVESASLKGAADAVENAGLTRRREGQLDNWKLLPQAAPGVSLITAADGSVLRNASADAAELLQVIPARGGQPFTLEVRGRAEKRAAATANPTLELYWLDPAGAALVPPVVLDFSPEVFDTATAQGDAPKQATHAEIHLVVPPLTAFKVERVSLRFATVMEVPLNFFAHAPGELTLLDWRVAFEEVKPAPPAPPAGGLCTPSRPGGTPGGHNGHGGTADDHSQFCPHCGAERPVRQSARVETRSGRAATLGRCTACGDEVATFQTTGAPDRTTLALSRSAITRAALRLTGAPRMPPHAESHVELKEAAAQPFAAIKGIAEVRTKELATLGVTSVETLAAATPEELAQAPSIPPKLAANLINQANELLKSETDSRPPEPTASN